MSILDKSSLVMIPCGYKEDKLYSVKPRNGEGDFTFTRASTGTRVNSDGYIEDVATNVPRLDYTNSTTPTLLLEGQSTNLVTDSQNYNSAYWGKQQGILSDGGVGLFYLSPTSNVIKYEVTQTQYNQMYYRLPSNVTIGNTYTQQGYVKCDDAPYIHFQIHALTNNPRVVWDNVNKEVITSPSSIDSVNIISLSDGWIKAEITYTASQASIYASIKTYFSTSSSSFYAGVPIGTIAYQTFVQVENLPYATSYIPTNGTSVTRVNDFCGDAGDATIFNSSEGVLFVEMAALAEYSLQRRITLSYDGQNYVRINVKDSKIYYQVRNNGAYQASGNYTVSDITDFNKIAVKYKEDDFALWINGVEVRTDTSGLTSFASPLDHLNFSSTNGNAQKFEGKVKQLITFNEALTDSELEELTTI